MMHPLSTVRWPALVGLCLYLAAAEPAFGQLDLGAIGGNAQDAAGVDEAPVTVAAHIAPAKDGAPAQLVVTADIAAGWHIYSLTQKRGGPVPSKIAVEPGPGYKLGGDFTPAQAPETYLEPVFNNLAVEKHEGKVVWSAPLELSADFDIAKSSIIGKFSYQACDESSCRPPTSVKFTAVLNADAVAPAAASAAKPASASPAKPASSAVGLYKTNTAHVAIRGDIEPSVAAAGQKAKVVIIAEPEGGYHVYALADRDPQKGSKPTLIVLREPSGWNASAPATDGQLVEKESITAPGETDRYYETPVTWTIDVDVAKDATPGDYKLAGFIGFQTCREDKGCDFPQAVEFQATLPVAAQSVAGKIPLQFVPAKSYKQVADLVVERNPDGTSQAAATTSFDLSKIRPDTPDPSDQSFLVMMGFGFLGGLILNLMPCVLPVIGLKIFSFVEHSGQDRQRILLLNVWYSLGILAVFMVLATLPVVYHVFQEKQFGWGQQFAYDGFNITLTAIVFVMALSFLGVWEIPIPGFVGGSKANELALQEGATGAFAKGALATVLATPCSGPFLGTALAFALAEPPYVTYAMFACIGLGMAFPYLVIGAFPRLIRFLPRPGAWMETFKQVMGFVLLGTVVYLMTVIQSAATVPTVALLVGLWFACWWIGRVPLYAEFGAKIRAWIGGTVAAAIVGVVAFQWLGPIMASRVQLAIDKQVQDQVRAAGQGASAISTHERTLGKFELPWEPYSFAKLQELTRDGKTVMLDFTADWCQTCQWLKAYVLDTAETRALVKANNVVPLLVDMTRFPEEEASLLKTVSGGQSIPVLAIFPAARPNEPIVLRNAYTQGMLLKRLRDAGPSMDASELTALKSPR